MIDIYRRKELWDQGYWEIPDNLDTKDFDFNWRPDPYDRPYVHQFGTQWQKTGGPRFIVPENEGIKFQSSQHAIRLSDPNSRNWRPLQANVRMDYSWHPDDTDPPFIYVFGNQWYDSTTMPTIQYRVKGATEKKYITEVHATLQSNKDNWVIPDDIADGFDYSWVPNPHEPPFIYQFGTQHQKTGGPAYTVKHADTVKYIDTIRAFKKANMRNWRIPEAIEDGFDFTWHPDDTEPPFMYEFATQWQSNGGPIYVTRGASVKKYTDSQLAIRKPNMRNWRILESIVSDNFDFSWHPDETEEPYTYVFGNGYYPPEIMPTVMYRCRDSVGTKYVTNPIAELKIDIVGYEDSIFDSLRNHHFTTKYVHFTKDNSTVDYVKIIPNISNASYLHILNDKSAIVPADAKTKLYDKLSDYPDVMYHRLPSKAKPLDIIFISNGEECAEDNYKHLVSLNLPNRIVRVSNVNGRVVSQHAAANSSETPWYFLINAKLKVNKDFDFNWQPNIMQTRKHYIFTAKNPINGLEYGHMAIVVNNKKLTLSTAGTGLDFTMESPHEVVDILSGTAMFNSSWDVWRTAFRECIKLCNSTDDESNKRLVVWSNSGQGQYAQDSINGARDAISYYTTVNGDFNQLMNSYDWQWLRKFYDDKYKL